MRKRCTRKSCKAFPLFVTMQGLIPSSSFFLLSSFFFLLLLSFFLSFLFSQGLMDPTNDMWQQDMGISITAMSNECRSQWFHHNLERCYGLDKCSSTRQRLEVCRVRQVWNASEWKKFLAYFGRYFFSFWLNFDTHFCFSISSTLR